MANIMILHHAPSIGGGSLSFYDISMMLKEEHNVTMCCPGTPTDLRDYLLSKGEDPLIIEIPIPTFNHYNGGHSIWTRTFWNGIYNLKYKKEWADFFNLHAPDLVIVNSSVMSLLGPALNEAGIKSICFVRETFVESVWSIRTRIMKTLINKWFDGVLFISNYDRNYAGLKNALTGNVADVVRPDYLTKYEQKFAIEKLGLIQEDYNILFVGGASYIKGLDIALGALEYLDKRKVKLIVAGETDLTLSNSSWRKKFSLRNIINFNRLKYRKKLIGLLQNECIQEKVNFVGLQTDMSLCYSAADVVIFPSNLPHQSRPLYEAGYFSKPIIISDFKQTKEFVENGKNGFVFDVKNPKSLADKLKELYDHPDLRIQLGDENKLSTEKYHNYTTEKNKLLILINTVISS